MVCITDFYLLHIRGYNVILSKSLSVSLSYIILFYEPLHKKKKEKKRRNLTVTSNNILYISIYHIYYIHLLLLLSVFIGIILFFFFSLHRTNNNYFIAGEFTDKLDVDAATTADFFFSLIMRILFKTYTFIMKFLLQSNCVHL